MDLESIQKFHSFPLSSQAPSTFARFCSNIPFDNRVSLFASRWPLLDWHKPGMAWLLASGHSLGYVLVFLRPNAKQQLGTRTVPNLAVLLLGPRPSFLVGSTELVQAGIHVGWWM